MAPMPSPVDVINKRLSGKNIWRPLGNSSALPILNMVGAPKITSGTRNLKEPIVISAAGIPVLPQASQVRNSCREIFLISTNSFSSALVKLEKHSAISVP
jgi:hypothetical protein